MIAIINYGSGNVRAIGNIYDSLRIPYQIVDRPEEVLNADRIILPGVGAFDETMKMLNDSGFREVLDESVLTQKKMVLGICVGMQILARGSEEGNLEGLGWIPGFVKKFDKATLTEKPKLPHLGWNSITPKLQAPLLAGIDENVGFYFLHSYFFECKYPEHVLSTTFYGHEFASSLMKENILGTQFHPEKSHSNGVRLLKNFASL